VPTQVLRESGKDFAAILGAASRSSGKVARLGRPKIAESGKELPIHIV
jgi:hypothetical protein